MACVLGNLFAAGVSCLPGAIRVPREPAFPFTERQKGRGARGFQEDIFGEYRQESRHVPGKQSSFPQRKKPTESMRSIKSDVHFQVKDIEDEYSVKSTRDNIKDELRSCWQQIKPLFLSPNIFKLIAIGMIQLGATIGSDRLDFPSKYISYTLTL